MGNGKGSGTVAPLIGPRVIAGEQNVAVMNEWRGLLTDPKKPLNPGGLRFVYQNVYPKTVLTEADQRLQRGQVMSAEAVASELGADMQPIYDYLVGKVHFLKVGNRPHNAYADLSRHLWDTAYRAQLMGLPLSQRQLALIHSLPEYVARGLVEARRFVAAIRGNFGENVADGLERLTDWDGILVDHLRYFVERIGSNGNSGSLENLKKRLAKISTKDERGRVVETLEDVLKLPASSAGSNRRLIPLELADSPIYPEAKARLHAVYVDRLVETSDYDGTSLVVKSLCLIDRLRTVDGVVQVEKITRETADFLPRLDEMLELLHRHKTVNNVLEFVAAALKTEFLIELDQRAAQARGMRDTRFASFTDLLGSRLASARQRYGSTAAEMGYTPASTAPNLRIR